MLEKTFNMSEEQLEQNQESFDQMCSVYDATCQNCRTGVKLQHKKWTSPTGWCKEKEGDQQP